MDSGLGLVTRVEHLISASRQIKDLHNADGIEVKDFENPQTLIVTGIQGGPTARTTKTETKIANSHPVCGGSPFIVRLSAGALKEEMPGALPPISGQHAETDPMLRASGLPYNIIRAHFFMQNTMMAAQTVASDGVVYMPFKDGKVGMIDVRDVAYVAVKVLTEDGHEGKTYTLTGPASISFHDVAAGLSKALGKEVKYVDVPLEAGREGMISMGLHLVHGLGAGFDGGVLDDL